MRSATPKKDDRDAVYSLRVKRERLEEVRKIAERRHRTISQQLRVAIDEHIEANREAA